MTNQGIEPMKQQAATEASDLKDTVKDEASNLASTVGHEGKGVAAEAKHQAKGLLEESVTQLRSQASTGQQRLAEVVRSLSSEADEMSSASTQSGAVTKLAADASRVGEDLASWLESHGPDDVLREVRRFATRRPGLFLAVSAGAGLLAGRFLRGVRDEQPETRALTSGYDPDRYSATATTSAFAPSAGAGGGSAVLEEQAYAYPEDSARRGQTEEWLQSPVGGDQTYSDQTYGQDHSVTFGEHPDTSRDEFGRSR